MAKDMDISLKIKMNPLGIQRLELLEREMALVFSPQGDWNLDRLIELVRQEPRTFQFKGEGKLLVSLGEEPGRFLTRLKILID